MNNAAPFAFVVVQHFVKLLKVVAGYAFCQNGNVVTSFTHVIAGRLYASGGIGTCNIKVCELIEVDEISELIARGGRSPCF